MQRVINTLSTSINIMTLRLKAAITHGRLVAPWDTKIRLFFEPRRLRSLPCWGGCPSCGWGVNAGTPCCSRRPGGGGWHRPVPRYPHPPLAVCWLPWLPLHLSPHMERLVAWKTSWKKKRGKEDRKDRQRERGENSEQYSRDDIRGWMELHDGGDG